MCPARLIDAADHEIRVEAAYSTPSLRPSVLTWCRLCRLHRCGYPQHPILTFSASQQDDAGVWIFRSAERWPAVAAGRRVHVLNAAGEVIARGPDLYGLEVPRLLDWHGIPCPLWCRHDWEGAITYRRPDA